MQVCVENSKIFNVTKRRVLTTGTFKVSVHSKIMYLFGIKKSGQHTPKKNLQDMVI